jgi:monoamine oxidase
MEGERASGEIDGERQFRAADGYGRLIDWLAQECAARGVAIRLQAIVRSVEWRKGRVAAHVETAGSEEALEAGAAVVTVPRGVLQAGGIRFDPEIAAQREAARRMVVGPVVRVTLQCKEQFWEDGLPAAGSGKLAELSFLHAREEAFPTWWTQYPLQANLITGWAGGPAATRLAGLGDADLTAAAIDSLARVTGLTPAELARIVERFYHHDWQKDPFARGAYSYVPAGALAAINALAEPCEQTLFFAGEATDTSGHTGTVHGAIASGLRAARQAASVTGTRD